MTLRPLFYSDQDCRDRLKPGKPRFFNVYRDPLMGLFVGNSHNARQHCDFLRIRGRTPYRIVVKAKPTPSPEKEDAA